MHKTTDQLIICSSFILNNFKLASYNIQHSNHYKYVGFLLQKLTKMKLYTRKMPLKYLL